MVDNPRGKLLNQSDHSSYFTVRNQLEDELCHELFSFGEMAMEETILGEETVTFFGITFSIANCSKSYYFPV